MVVAPRVGGGVGLNEPCVDFGLSKYVGIVEQIGYLSPPLDWHFWRVDLWDFPFR